MGAVFANAPIQPTVVAVQFSKIFFVVRCDIRRCAARATTNVRPIDHIGRPHANLDVCAAHAKALIERAQAKKLDVLMR